MNKKKIQKAVREAYGKIAQGQKGCGCGTCIPDEANFALSCGNPTALASLKEGEVVLDLGSGAGFDCFLAATKVGPKGKVIGMDMTPEMVEKARENAKKNGVENVELRLGEIENLPVGDNSVDVVISNCVINLSADKPKVFQEVYRVLKPGGRIAIADIALLKKLPKRIQNSTEAYVACVGGAILNDEYQRVVKASGLKDVKITVKSPSVCGEKSLEGSVVSVYVEGRK